MDEKKYQQLYAELSKYEHVGISIKLNNRPASPMQIVSALMVKEDNSYMRDYVWDETGHITELAFHNIKNS